MLQEVVTLFFRCASSTLWWKIKHREQFCFLRPKVLPFPILSASNSFWDISAFRLSSVGRNAKTLLVWTWRSRFGELRKTHGLVAMTRHDLLGLGVVSSSEVVLVGFLLSPGILTLLTRLASFLSIPLINWHESTSLFVYNTVNSQLFLTCVQNMSWHEYHIIELLAHKQKPLNDECQVFSFVWQRSCLLCR